MRTLAQLQAVNGLKDTMEISYAYPVGADFTQSFITVSQSATNRVLNFSGGSTLGVDNGNPFYLNIVLPGNWSTQGTSQGDHNFISIDPTWTNYAGLFVQRCGHRFRGRRTEFPGRQSESQFPIDRSAGSRTINLAHDGYRPGKAGRG